MQSMFAAVAWLLCFFLLQPNAVASTAHHKHATHLAKTRKIIIVIDPGHGGKDPGALGHSGIAEKKLVLAISRDLQKEINQIKGFRAILTRRNDRYISLR